MPDKPPSSYFDIGHNAGSYVWLIDEEVLVRFRGGTHEEIWGVRKSFTSWRGRFDPETSQASIAAPENWSGTPPQGVLRKVVAAFHPTAMWLFPWPPGSPPQLVPRQRHQLLTETAIAKDLTSRLATIGVPCEEPPEYDPETDSCPFAVQREFRAGWFCIDVCSHGILLYHLRGKPDPTFDPDGGINCPTVERAVNAVKALALGVDFDQEKLDPGDWWK